jgi:hypothetical protein
MGPSPGSLKLATLSHEQMWERGHTPTAPLPGPSPCKLPHGEGRTRAGFLRPRAVEAPSVDASAATSRGLPLPERRIHPLRRAPTKPIARAGAASQQYREAFSRCCGEFTRSAHPRRRQDLPPARLPSPVQVKSSRLFGKTFRCCCGKFICSAHPPPRQSPPPHTEPVRPDNPPPVRFGGGWVSNANPGGGRPGARGASRASLACCSRSPERPAGPARVGAALLPGGPPRHVVPPDPHIRSTEHA